MTLHGHRVAVYLDTRREELGEEWDQGLAAGLLHSLCFVPLLSFGCTAPLAAIRQDCSLPPPADVLDERQGQGALAEGWPATPLGLRRMEGGEEDDEDGVLKVVSVPVTREKQCCLNWMD